jgi:single-strand DNA-binding protein
VFHEIKIIGNLGKEPELKFTPDGKAVCTFSVAASNKKDETVWYRITTWEKLAEVCNQYLHKGSKVFVNGALKADAQGNPRTYERKDGGGWAASFEVVASSVKFLSGKDEPADEVPF